MKQYTSTFYLISSVGWNLE